jgi:hypothetical protein
MVNGPYYSDRQGSTQPRIKEGISPTTWGGIIAAIDTRFENGSFGERFPLICQRTSLAYGCNQRNFVAALKSRIPNLEWPLNPSKVPDTLDVLDLLEFCYDAVGQVEEVVEEPSLDEVIQRLGSIFPDKPCHRHIQFSVEEGEDDFREEINYIFARNGVAYEFDEEGYIVRLGPEVLRETLTSAIFRTGDSTLDSLLETARRKFLNPDIIVRQESLEKLWDAWERLKTLHTPNKQKGISDLLERAVPDPNLRNRINQEAVALTNIGNDFMIRHSETNKIKIEQSEHVDYLFQRLFALIWMIIKGCKKPDT